MHSAFFPSQEPCLWNGIPGWFSDTLSYIFLFRSFLPEWSQKSLHNDIFIISWAPSVKS